MRTTDFDVVQAPEGYIPHRTIFRSTSANSGTSRSVVRRQPALDGMLGAVLKTYREVRQGGDLAWLRDHWENVQRLLEYIRRTWDADGDGVLEGEQGNTYDIHFFGPNIYIGGLVAGRAPGRRGARAARGRRTLRRRAARPFEAGSARYDELLWNGEYYIQLLDEGPARGPVRRRLPR